MKKLKNLSLIFYNLALCQFALAAQVVETNNHKPEEVFIHSQLPNKHIATGAAPQPTAQPSLVLTEQQLAQQPQLLLQLLVQALKYNDVARVEFLLPIYQQQPQTDAELLKWAAAFMAYHQQDLSKAIQLYRELLADDPSQQAMRLQLAIALFHNKQNEAAEAQFNKLRNENLPTPIQALVEDYLRALDQQNQFQFYVSFNYLKESNVNNAPKAGLKSEGFSPSSRPEQAEGVGYYANAHKIWSLSQGFFVDLDTDIYGKYYWQNGKYNELAIQPKLGFGYRDLQQEIKFAPYVEQLWYAGGQQAENNRLKRYSRQAGIELSYSRWLQKQWQISTALQYGEQRYQAPQYKLSDGNYYWLSGKLSYYASAQQSWHFGAEYYRKNAQYKANAFDRYGVFIGWAQEWKGISSYLQLNYARRIYQMASAQPEDIFAPSFFKQKQKNHEYAINFSLWHRAIHFKGITPKITYSYQKTSSNNLFAEYDRQRVYLTFSKAF